MWSLGNMPIDVPVGRETVTVNCLILDTNAFEAILGMDFLRHPKVKGLMMNPPALLVGEDQIGLDELETTETTHRLLRTFRTEAYTLEPSIRTEVIKELGEANESLIDMFASDQNAQSDLYCSKQGNSSWGYN